MPFPFIKNKIYLFIGNIITGHSNSIVCLCYLRTIYFNKKNNSNAKRNDPSLEATRA